MDLYGLGVVFFLEGFYWDVYCMLMLGGVLVIQNGVLFLQCDELVISVEWFFCIFKDVVVYIVVILIYFGGYMMLGWVIDNLDLCW